MDGATGTGMFGIQERIGARHATVSKSMPLQRRLNRIQVVSIDGHVNVLGQPSGHRVHRIDVQEDREAAHDPVRDACSLER
jgi:hypothetical protein